MTEISAKIVEDSISPSGVRLTTMQLRYPRWIHAEVMTHRVFSRNASSSRAIPVDKMLSSVEDHPAMPLVWSINQPGMQASSYLTDHSQISAARGLWLQAMRTCVRMSRDLFGLLGLHKQVVNRLTEPFQLIDVIVSATDFENFFALRCHPDAEPHLQALAWLMADAYYVNASPVVCEIGDWHLPYVTKEERANTPVETLKACSVARCARVSYRTHDGAEPSVAKDVALHQRLLAGLVRNEGEPGHMSPFEHQATPLESTDTRSGNFRGWEQYRKQIKGESMSFDYQASVEKGWRNKALSIIDNRA